MDLSLIGINASLSFTIRDEDGESAVSLHADVGNSSFLFENSKYRVGFELSADGHFLLSLDSVKPVSVRIHMTPVTGGTGYHVIPCNIHGDNNLGNARPGFFPNLTEENPGFKSSSPEWEFRADRASHPVSMIHIDNRTFGISIDPYSVDSDGAIIANGVFSKLPKTAGVSMGYRNHPYTFTFKETFDEPTFNLAIKTYAKGRIYEITGNRNESMSVILRDIHRERRNCPSPAESTVRYLESFLDSYENINWSDELNAFTNMECRVPDSPDLKPWRPLIATGWTGTGVMAYPLLSAQILLGIRNDFTDKLIGQFDMVARSINPDTGMFFDLTRELNGSRVNGWWAGYMVKDCHCAYTNGNGAYYLLKAYQLMKNSGVDKPEWLRAARTVIDAVTGLQLPDGNYGYTYSTDKPGIIDRNGFAGCWFATASALLHEITGEKTYLHSAEKAMDFYHGSVVALDCFGTPMDTWKSIDQEGNLAFIKAAAILHRITGSDKYKQMLQDGAGYEYLWRYSYKAMPLHPPLKDSGWNSCGGSVTSVSNPHIHPMGVNVTADLLYLYKITGDRYHLERAEDGLCWGLASCDMYPKTTGYGRLGVVTERWCPSDGLVIEKFSDSGLPASIWFTFNGWAGASIVEGLIEPFISKIADRTVDSNPGIHDIFNKIIREVEQ